MSSYMGLFSSMKFHGALFITTLPYLHASGWNATQ
jgi:hypothetical protein